MNNEKPITAMLMVKVPNQDHWQGMGQKAFTVLPRIGEFIEINVDDVGYTYSVVAVAHPSEPMVNMGNIYIVELGKTPDVLKQLFESAKLPAKPYNPLWVEKA